MVGAKEREQGQHEPTSKPSFQFRWTLRIVSMAEVREILRGLGL